MVSSQNYHLLSEVHQGSGYALSTFTIPAPENVQRKDHISLTSRFLRRAISDERLIADGKDDSYPRGFVRRFSDRFLAWRGGVAASAILVAIVLVINVAFTFWAVRRYDLKNSIGTLYEGSCQRTQALSTAAHLIINLLSTGMFGGSNYCMYA